MEGVMDTLLLDTNIVSFLFKKDSRAKTYAPYLQGKMQAKKDAKEALWKALSFIPATCKPLYRRLDVVVSRQDFHFTLIQNVLPV